MALSMRRVQVASLRHPTASIYGMSACGGAIAGVIQAIVLEQLLYSVVSAVLLTLVLGFCIDRRARRFNDYWRTREIAREDWYDVVMAVRKGRQIANPALAAHAVWLANELDRDLTSSRQIKLLWIAGAFNLLLSVFYIVLSVFETSTWYVAGALFFALIGFGSIFSEKLNARTVRKVRRARDQAQELIDAN